MNNICFLIVAHKNYNQTMRLINHLKKYFDLYVRMQSDLKNFGKRLFKISCLEMQRSENKN